MSDCRQIEVHVNKLNQTDQNKFTPAWNLSSKAGEKHVTDTCIRWNDIVYVIWWMDCFDTNSKHP